MSTRKTLAFITPLIVALAFNGCSVSRGPGENDDFVRVRGTQFFLHGHPYYFTGTNMWHGCYLGSAGSTGDRPRLLRELDSLKAYGITNIRALAASENSAIRHSVKPAIQIAPGVADDTLLEGLDFFLAELGRREMHAVLYLGNYWEWSGGMSQYNVWTGDKTVDPEDTTQGWGAFMDFSASFYLNPKAIEMNRDYIRLIVTRRNTITGVRYIDDPTIMSWQLANEPRPGRDGEAGRKNLPAFYHWIDTTARFIHSLDPHHLVNAGSEGLVGMLQSEEYFKQAFKTPALDYLTLHLWPLNWGWFNPQQWEETLPPTETKAVAYISRHFALARELGKPVVMDEFGLGRDGGAILPGTPTQARDTYFALIYSVIEDSAKNGAPIGGTNFWAWGGEGHVRHADGMWQRGDPYIGDPPQEPQGRNSVFISDTSTLLIVRDNALYMRALELVETPLSVKNR